MYLRKHVYWRSLNRTASWASWYEFVFDSTAQLRRVQTKTTTRALTLSWRLFWNKEHILNAWRLWTDKMESQTVSATKPWKGSPTQLASRSDISLSERDTDGRFTNTHAAPSNVEDASLTSRTLRLPFMHEPSVSLKHGEHPKGNAELPL